MRTEFEIALGMLGALLTYLASIAVFAYFYPAIRGAKEVLALLPVISDIRGDIMGSSASRMITSLHLGVLKPSPLELLRAEALNVAAAVVTTSILISLFVAGWYAVAYSEMLDINMLVSTSILASLAITLIALPSVAIATARLFARGFDPGNVMPTLITVSIDLMAIPSLALAYIALAKSSHSFIALLALASATSSVAVAVAVMLLGGVQARVFKERTGIVTLVIAGQAVAGVFLAGFEDRLATSGLIHVTPAFIGVSGALASIAGLKIALHVYVNGYRGVERVALASLLDALAVGGLSMIPLGLIGYVTAGGDIYKAPLATTIAVLVASLVSVLLLAVPIAYLLVRASFALGVMPENVLLPLLTTVVDVTGIVVLSLLGSIAV
ncbi:MAG: magnesium transporter [Acidilobaceae archaeon]